MGSMLSSYSQAQPKYHGLIFVDGVFQGRGKIRITNEEIILKQGGAKRVFEIRHLRRYGTTAANQFFFECGRSCEVGPKEFIISTDQAEALHQQVECAKEGMIRTDEETRRKSASAHQLIGASYGKHPGTLTSGMLHSSSKNPKAKGSPLEGGKNYSVVEIYSRVSRNKSCSEGALHNIPRHNTLYPYVNIDRERTVALNTTLASVRRS